MTAGKKKRRAKGEGSLQQLAKGRYKVQITVGYDLNGRQIRRSFTAKSQGDAVRMLNKFKADQLQDTLTAPNDLTFSRFADRWLQSKKIAAKAKSHATYELAVKNHLIPALGNYKIQKLTTAHINDYLAAKIRSGLSLATTRQHRAILHNIMAQALNEGLIRQNPVAKAAPLPPAKTEQNILTQAEIKKLLTTAENYQQQTGRTLNCLYHIILLALATGLRRGELLALRWTSIDLAAKTIQVRENLVEIKGRPILDTPKTGNSRRIIAVDPQILNLLIHDLWNEDKGPVFRTAAGRHVPFSTLGRLFRLLLKQAGIEKPIRFHDLRHTHVSHLLAAGYDLKMVARRIGDDVKTALTIYAHALPEKDREAARFIGESLLY